MKVIDENSPLQKIMREALTIGGFKFQEEVSIYETKTSNPMPKYIVDFVVYGELCKIAVECDGRTYHSKYKQRKHDALRDLWLIQHGFSDVLRYGTKDIKRHIYRCIDEIRRVLEANDNVKKERLRKSNSGLSVPVN